MTKVNIVWFNHDQRVLDHEGILSAQSLTLPVIGIYILDPTWLHDKPFGIPKMSGHRRQFLTDSLTDLKRNLSQFNIPLYVFIDDVENVFTRLKQSFSIDLVYTMHEVGQEKLDRVHQINAAHADIPIQFYEGKTMIHPRDLPMDLTQLPDVFTVFRKAIEQAKVKPRLVLGSPKVQTVEFVDFKDDFHRLMESFEYNPQTLLKGGETEGLARLEHYFFETKKLQFYKLTRNQMYRLDDSSKLSPYLALGNLSPRYVYAQIKQFEVMISDNISTYWLYFELLWRDYFQFSHMKYGNRLFHSGGLFKKPIYTVVNHTWIEQWKNGETGYPLVDANMIELKTTGWMSNRGRQNVASFFTKYIQQDWRIGAMWFESLLIDYDPASNYGNWLYQAGLGVDPRSNRVFDVIWQGEKYDPTTIYLRKWLPQFKKVPKMYRYQPMAMSIEEQNACDFVLGKDYPRPIVPNPIKHKNLK